MKAPKLAEEIKEALLDVGFIFDIDVIGSHLVITTGGGQRFTVRVSENTQWRDRRIVEEP